jgi:HlyD family type I secretion membrane fusion protein
LREQHAALRELAERGLYPRLKLQASAKELADAEGAAARAAATLEAVRSALAEAQARRAAVASERRRALLAELAEARADAARLAEQLAAQTARRNGLELRAPVAGIVQDIKITGAGQSIAANEPILRIVPSDTGLVIEARIANADIGRLAIGDGARVKVQAYDYLRYGTLAGTVRHIAADASVRVAGEEAGYLVTVVTGRTHLGARPGEQDVLPGMLAEIEIEVGERTILSYLTDRLRRVGDGAFRDG